MRPRMVIGVMNKMTGEGTSTLTSIVEGARFVYHSSS